MGQNGKKIMEIKLNQLKNKDWEDIAKDSENYYIADTGNNNATRENLKIYILDYDFFLRGEISIKYKSQPTFSKEPINEFDAEALAVVGEELILFSKNRKTLKSEIYSFPKIAGNYILEPKASINSDALITAADYQEGNDMMALTGYNFNGDQFFYIIRNFVKNGYNNIKLERYFIPIKPAQIEAVKIIDLAKILSGKVYFSFRETLKLIISAFSKRFKNQAGKAEDFLRSAVTGGTLFNSMGFYYIGPIDGHDIDSMVSVFNNVKDINYDGPILIHVKTEKGKGYSFAEKSEDKFHGVSKFNIKTGEQEKSKSNTPSYTKVFANSLIKHAENDSKIVGITAAMPSGTGMDLFGKKFPERMFDVGIAEQHAVTFAAGMATEGYKPYAAIYSTFLQRAYDQVVHDVAIQSLPVRFAIDRAGLVGADGPTHAGSFDITYLSTLPNFVVMAASDEAELVRMINTSMDINDRPSAFRYPRGNGVGVQLPEITEKIELGKAKIIKEGKKVAILNFGARLQECILASENLTKKGIDISIIDARFAKPLDENLIWQIATEHEVLITIEEGSIGGFGSHVSQFLSEKNLLDSNLKFRSMILPDRFIDHDKPELMYKFANLDSIGI